MNELKKLTYYKLILLLISSSPIFLFILVKTKTYLDIRIELNHFYEADKIVNNNKSFTNLDSIMSLYKNRLKLLNKDPLARQKFYQETLIADLTLVNFFNKNEKLKTDNFININYSDQKNFKPETYDFILKKSVTLSSQLVNLRSKYSDIYTHVEMILKNPNWKTITMGALKGPSLENYNENDFLNLDSEDVRQIFVRSKTKLEDKYSSKDLQDSAIKSYKNFKFSFKSKKDCQNELFCSEFFYCLFDSIPNLKNDNPYLSDNTNLYHFEMLKQFGSSQSPEPT